jgi:protein phosphatase
LWSLSDRKAAAVSQPSSDTEIIPSTAPALPPPVRPAVRSFGRTDPGKVRPSNEDQFLIAELGRVMWVHHTSLSLPQTQHGLNRAHVFLVADGMGGHQAGEVASALTVATLEGFILNVLRRFSNLQDADEQTVLKDFQTALRQADARIFEETAHRPEFKGMGTTLTMALASNWKLFVVHAGDSRCYLFRAGELRQLTTDHTLVGELVRRGVLKPEEATHHQFRHVITSFVGGGERGGQVEVKKLDLQAGDVLLLCSDGLTEMLADDRIRAFLQAEPDPRAACDRLVAEANERGGRDNVTAVVARFEAAPAEERPPDSPGDGH